MLTRIVQSSLTDASVKRPGASNPTTRIKSFCITVALVPVLLVIGLRGGSQR